MMSALRERWRVGDTAGLVANARRAPLGILIIASLAATIGVGSLVAGIYLILLDEAPNTWAGGVSIVLGPAVLYLGYHLVSLARWAWLALIVLLVLLMTSALVRIVISPGLPGAAAAELGFEILGAFYLMRPGVRGRFSRETG